MMLRTRVMAGPGAAAVLAIVLAAALTLLYSLEILVPSWRVRPGIPAPVTLRLPPEDVAVTPIRDAPGVTAIASEWETHRIIVARGAVARGGIGAFVQRYEAARRPIQWRGALGLFSIYFLTSLLMFTYLRIFAPSQGRLLRTQIGLFGVVFAIGALTKLTLLFTGLSEYYVPVSIVSLWAALYIERRAALLLNIVLAFLLASFVRFDLTLIAVFLARGFVTALAFRDRKHPRGMIGAGLVGGFAGALMLVACRLLFAGNFGFAEDLNRGLESGLVACLLGGFVSGLGAWLLAEPAQLAFGAVSRAQLVDLSDLDHPVLRKMAAEAPGSWQHARAMANLAEDAAAAIGADAMLTRTGAYYHDLGKTIQPKYFVENLEAGERSPHEDLEPDVSADAIMAHVVGGTKILREAGIPEPVIEFAYTHHGTSVIEFFWHKCLQQGNPKALTADAFRYPGMKPHTRETAILMLIDSIEAASRTIDPPDREKFEEMIQRVIFTKLRQGQLDDAGLTVKDIRVLISSLAETLVKVYHHRVKYPWQQRASVAPTPEPVEKKVVPAPVQAVEETQPAEANGASEQSGDSDAEIEGPRASDPPPEPE
jgi:putative nucleotidyltransferase with HDIG domain